MSKGSHQTALTVQQLRIAAAQMQRSQALARVGQESIEAQKLPGGTPEEHRQRDAELNRLKIEGLKAEGELERQIDDAHQDRIVKILELQKCEMEEIQNKAAGLFHTLFTKPEEFGKQLANTMKEAVLKPITDGQGGGFTLPSLSRVAGTAQVPAIMKAAMGGGSASPGGGGGGTWGNNLRASWGSLKSRKARAGQRLRAANTSRSILLADGPMPRGAHRVRGWLGRCSR